MNTMMNEDDRTQDKAVAKCMRQWDETEGVENLPIDELIKITIKDKKKDWRRIEFLTPITETVFSNEGNDFLIKGVAINETTTRNGVHYASKKQQKAAFTLRNKPILKDHNNSVDSIVGRTTQNVNFDDSNRRITFEAKIMDKKMQEMISDGRIQSVSIGAMVKELKERADDDGGGVQAMGIDFVELSLVAVPADPNAGLTRAIMESFDIKKKQDAETDLVKEL